MQTEVQNLKTENLLFDNKKYQKAFRDVSPQKKLVHLASFEEFIQYKHQKYMKD